MNESLMGMGSSDREESWRMLTNLQSRVCWLHLGSESPQRTWR